MILRDSFHRCQVLQPLELPEMELPEMELPEMAPPEMALPEMALQEKAAHPETRRRSIFTLAVDIDTLFCMFCKAV